MLTIQELQSSTLKELLQELQSASRALQQTRIGTRTKHQKDSSLVKKSRRYIARVKTVIREMELEETVKNASEINPQ